MTRAETPQGPPRGWRPCRPATPRCRFWEWGPEADRPECCTRGLRTLLEFGTTLLARHGIPHWLDFGSLLGAVRERTMIPWDSDVDLGLLRDDLPRVRSLEGQILDAGHWLDTRNPDVWRICLSRVNTLHVDLYPFWEEDGCLKLRWPGYPPERWAFPPRFLSRLEPVELDGRSYLAPAPVHEFLAEHRYGPDYRTPRRPVASRVPDIPVPQLTPAVGQLLEEIRRRDARIEALSRRLDARWRARWRGRAARAWAAVRLRRDRARFLRNLVRLHEVLRTTPLGDRYWIIGGLLIGWAREGRILRHDALDADFGFWRRDREIFPAVAGRLVHAGFWPQYRWVSNTGDPVEYTFTKDGAKFEFFEHEDAGATVRCRYFGGTWGSVDWVERVSAVPAFRLTPMSFLGRTWLKPDDHDRFLTAVYGPWRVPDPDFWVAGPGDRSVVEVRRWTGTNEWIRR